jgi:hypothetical protein
MSDQSNVDAFVKWGKARLDEMGAAAKALEDELGKLDGQGRQEVEQAVKKIRQWVSDGEAELKKMQGQGEKSLARAKSYFDKAWSDFETDTSNWVEIANNQRETFEAQAKAQLAAWHAIVDSYMEQAAQIHSVHREAAEQELERLKGEAEKAEARLGEFRKAGEKSWTAMSKALEASREAFETAAQHAWKEFHKATNIKD